MMNYWTIFGTAFIVGLSGAVTPGPVLALCVSETTRRGFVAAPLIVLGHAVLEALLIVCLVAGLGSVLLKDMVLGPIAVAGALVLVWMGVMMVRSSVRRKVELDLSMEAATSGVGVPIVGGLLTSLANPYWVVWWATVGLTYIGASLERGTAGLLAFFSGHILSDLAWYSVVAAAITAGRRSFIKRVYPWLNLVCGCFLVGIGGYFLWFGISRLMRA
jgi:threonine/homoserine/homoserine lactone efflux protein